MSHVPETISWPTAVDIQREIDNGQLWSRADRIHALFEPKVRYGHIDECGCSGCCYTRGRDEDMSKIRAIAKEPSYGA